MAAEISDPTSAARVALSNTFARATSLHTDFAEYADGPPLAGGEGLPFVLNPSADVMARPRVVGGALTFAAAGAAAGYAQQVMAAPVRRIGAEFSFAASSGTRDPGTGNATLVVWQNVIPTPYSVPKSPLHLVINQFNWTLDLWNDGQVFIGAIGAGDFLVPLDESPRVSWRLGYLDPTPAGTGVSG